MRARKACGWSSVRCPWRSCAMRRGHLKGSRWRTGASSRRTCVLGHRPGAAEDIARRSTAWRSTRRAESPWTPRRAAPGTPMSSPAATAPARAGRRDRRAGRQARGPGDRRGVRREVGRGRADARGARLGVAAEVRHGRRPHSLAGPRARASRAGRGGARYITGVRFRSGSSAIAVVYATRVANGNPVGTTITNYGVLGNNFSQPRRRSSIRSAPATSTWSRRPVDRRACHGRSRQLHRRDDRDARR